MKKLLKTIMLLALFLLLLAACGGGADEALEESGDADTTEEMDEASDSEAVGDDDIGATGSEEDSGEIPPTPQPGGKVETARATPDPSGADLIATSATTQPADRVESGDTAVLPSLDFVLLTDTTGSMAPELSQLQASLPNLTANLAIVAETSDLRLGLVTYRDIGKEAAVQIYEFTDDLALFTDQLANVTAVGGGDYPEAMIEGFYQAITNLAWRTDATKVVILLGDAPPQIGSVNAPTLQEISRLATVNDLTIFTIGSDGLDAAGVEIYAQMAQKGNGRFLFLTDNPDNNIGNATAVYPTSQLALALIDIVQEVHNAQVP